MTPPVEIQVAPTPQFFQAPKAIPAWDGITRHSTTGRWGITTVSISQIPNWSDAIAGVSIHPLVFGVSVGGSCELDVRPVQFAEVLNICHRMESGSKNCLTIRWILQWFHVFLHGLSAISPLVREIPLFQENPGWWNIVICPGISRNLTAAEMAELASSCYSTSSHLDVSRDQIASHKSRAPKRPRDQSLFGIF